MQPGDKIWIRHVHKFGTRVLVQVKPARFVRWTEDQLYVLAAWCGHLSLLDPEDVSTCEPVTAWKPPLS